MTRMTSVMEHIYERARTSHARIILAEPYDSVAGKDDERVTQAAAAIRSEGLAQDIILLTPGYWDALGADVQAQLVQALQAARAGKEDIDDAAARARLSSDTKQLAAAMVKAELADGYVAGNICATADTIRPALQIIGTENGFASSFFIMRKGASEILFADSGFNVVPTPEQLARIGVDTARTAAMLGLEPRVAFLSFATYESASHPRVDAVRDAVRIAHTLAPGLVLDGPLQFDAAFDAGVAARKAPASLVAGHANVFVFPDLDSGNIAYKIAERMAGYQAIGPLMQGLRAPVNDLSRGCSAQDVVDAVAFTAMQTGMKHV